MSSYEVRRGPGREGPLSDAHEVRLEVFVGEQGVSEDVEMDDRDDESIHAVAYDGDGRPAATGRLREVGDGVGKVERVAVRREYRGRGLGRDVMEAVHEAARDEGFDRLVCHAQSRVEGFYRGLGYETVSEEFEEAGIPHVEMVRDR